MVVGGFAVDAENRVTGPNSGAVGRSIGERVVHDRLAPKQPDLHADAGIAALLLLAEALEVAGVEKLRMRIESLEHARDGAIENSVRAIDRGGVALGDDVQRRLELPDLQLNLVGRCDASQAAEEARVALADGCADEDRDRNASDGSQLSQSLRSGLRHSLSIRRVYSGPCGGPGW